MAFDAKNLSPTGDTGKTGKVPTFWTFWNEDSDTVTAAAYITGVLGKMTVGDQVTVVDGDYGNSANYNVSAVTNTGATLVANS